MERKGMLFLALLLLVSLVAAAALVGGSDGGSGAGANAVARPPGVPDDAPFVDGLLTEVRTDRLTIQPDGGEKTVEMTVPPERARVLDLQHLVNYHQSRDEPVRVFYEEREDVKRAIGAADLPGGPDAATGPSS